MQGNIGTIQAKILTGLAIVGQNHDASGQADDKLLINEMGVSRSRGSVGDVTDVITPARSERNAFRPVDYAERSTRIVVPRKC
jgi:hypothetical protein